MLSRLNWEGSSKLESPGMMRSVTDSLWSCHHEINTKMNLRQLVSLKLTIVATARSRAAHLMYTYACYINADTHIYYIFSQGYIICSMQPYKSKTLLVACSWYKFPSIHWGWDLYNMEVNSSDLSYYNSYTMKWICCMSGQCSLASANPFS